MDIVEATRSYERWMAERLPLPVVKPDLALKHERMAESPFVFLRGTFYRWLQLWPAMCPTLARAPVVRSVGDVHVENFGTWRDGEGRLVWGVNNVDEACALPYTHDLVRLAASATLASRRGGLTRTSRDLCAAVLEGYATALERGGRPFVLAERRQWLRRLALNELRDPVVFWPKLDALATATGKIPHAELRASLPDPRLSYRVVRRVAGVGSLGRPRFVALADWGGARIAAGSQGVAAVGGRMGERPCLPPLGATLLAKAVRSPDPCFQFGSRWIVRRLAPDCSRVELEDLPGIRDEEKLLRAMGGELANIHLGQSPVAIRADLKKRPRRWLEEGASAMADVVFKPTGASGSSSRR